MDNIIMPTFNKDSSNPSNKDYKKGDAFANIEIMVDNEWSRFGSIPLYEDGKNSRGQSVPSHMQLLEWINAHATKKVKTSFEDGDGAEIELTLKVIIRSNKAKEVKAKSVVKSSFKAV
jgi:exoribonuclease II